MMQSYCQNCAPAHADVQVYAQLALGAVGVTRH